MNEAVKIALEALVFSFERLGDRVKALEAEVKSLKEKTHG